MDDRLVIEGVQGYWRWKRVTNGGQLLSMSGGGYPQIEKCRQEAERVNAEPYVVEIAEPVTVLPHAARC